MKSEICDKVQLDTLQRHTDLQLNQINAKMQYMSYSKGIKTK